MRRDSMANAYNIPILIQKKDEETEQWSDYLKLHARITRNKGQEYQKAGAIQSKSERIFEVRYQAHIKDIEFNTSLYRVVYAGINYNVTDYDDYLEKHINVKITGLSYD